MSAAKINLLLFSKIPRQIGYLFFSDKDFVSTIFPQFVKIKRDKGYVRGFGGITQLLSDLELLWLKLV